MPLRLAVDHVALTDDGPTLALSLGSGQSLAIVGRAASGKTQLLEVLAGERAPARGSAKVSGSVHFARSAEPGRRATPQSLATGGADDRDRAAEALGATALWEVRQTPVVELSPGRRRAAALLPALVSRADVLAVDALLDALDPWTLESVLGLLFSRLAAGQCLCLATNRPEVARQADVLVALAAQRVRFAGGEADLRRSGSASRVEVHTESRDAARALARPFEVTVSEEPFGVSFEAPEGQALAAKLLLEGYGDVKFVVLREATVSELLAGLV